MTYPEAAIFLITVYKLPLCFIPLLVVRDVRKQSRKDKTLLLVIRGRECVLRARDFERMKSAMRERLRTKSAHCARVYAEGWSEGLKYKGLEETARSFRGCQGYPQGNRRFSPSRAEGTNNTNFSRRKVHDERSR